MSETVATESVSDVLDRLTKLVNIETRGAVQRSPDAKPAADTMRELLFRLSGLSYFVEFEKEISADFVPLLQKAYSTARKAMTEDFRFALRPEHDDKLVEFEWPGAGKLEGETYCDILVFEIVQNVYRTIATTSDADGHIKALIAGKPYRLKPKAVVKAWPEILKSLRADAGTAPGVAGDNDGNRPCHARDTELYGIHASHKDSPTPWADTRDEWNRRHPEREFLAGDGSRDIIRRAVKKVEKERSDAKKV